MSDFGLSSQQLTVICALSTGATMAAAAQEAGVHRNTIHNWLRNLLPFQQALSDAQFHRALYFREKIEERIDLAFKTLDEILADQKAPAGVRLKAALTIIQTASTPPLPKKQVELDIEKIVIKPNAATVTEDQLQPAPPVHKNAQSTSEIPTDDSHVGLPENLHKDAQPASGICAHSRPFAASPTPQPPIPLKNRKIGRNELCPCGSGKKYKKCCIDKPVIGVRREFIERLASAA